MFWNNNRRFHMSNSIKKHGALMEGPLRVCRHVICCLLWRCVCIQLTLHNAAGDAQIEGAETIHGNCIINKGILCRTNIRPNRNEMISVLDHDSVLVMLYWARGQPGLIRLIVLWIMPLLRDRSLNLFTSSPARYLCTTNAPTGLNRTIAKHRLRGGKLVWHFI